MSSEQGHTHGPGARRETLYGRADWDRAVAEGTLVPEHVLDRLQRIAVHEFGVEGPAGYDEDGFFVSLTAEGLLLEGGVTVRVYTNDHLPPYVHVQRPAQPDIRINLESGDFLEPVPTGTSAKKLRKFQEVVQEHHGLLSSWWEKNYGTAVGEA